MQIKSDLPAAVSMHEDVGVPMPDGTRLSARIWIPDAADERPVPSILELLPYRKRDGTVARNCTMHPYFAGHGYACLRVDIRGNGDSDGLIEDEYTPQELSDACEVMKGAQPLETAELLTPGYCVTTSPTPRRERPSARYGSKRDTAGTFRTASRRHRRPMTLVRGGLASVCVSCSM